jgi:hypothetical protein
MTINVLTIKFSELEKPHKDCKLRRKCPKCPYGMLGVRSRLSAGIRLSRESCSYCGQIFKFEKED